MLWGYLAAEKSGFAKVLDFRHESAVIELSGRKLPARMKRLPGRRFTGAAAAGNLP